MIKSMTCILLACAATWLADGLNADELRDLLAYLMSGGDGGDKRVYGR